MELTRQKKKRHKTVLCKTSGFVKERIKYRRAKSSIRYRKKAISTITDKDVVALSLLKNVHLPNNKYSTN